MSETDPSLLIHLPMDEMRGNVLFDTTKNRHNATAAGAALVDDPEFGQCLALDGSPNAHVILPLLKLDPMSRGPFTFLMWIKTDAEVTLFDFGLGPGLQRLIVTFTGVGANPQYSVLMPTESAPANSIRYFYKFTDPAYTVKPDTWTHVAMVWRPSGTGSAELRLNGRSSTLISGSSSPGVAPPLIDPIEESFRGFLGRPSFKGRIAQFRLYARELTPEQILWDMEEDRPVRYRYRITHPLDFSLENRDTDPVLFLDGRPEGQNMSLRITPASRGELHLGEMPNQVASAENHHFELAFRPGTLTPGSLDKVSIAAPAEGWKIGSRPWANPDDHDSLYLLRTVPGRLSETGVTLALEHLVPDARYGTRTTLVDFRYRNIKTGGGETVAGSVAQKLDLITSLGRRNLPLHFGFAGSNRILNKAAAAQTLRLRITNIAIGGAEAGTLRFDGKSELVLSVDQLPGTDWALDTPEKIGRIVVRYAKGRAIGTSPEAQRSGGDPWLWRIPLQDLTLAPGETLELRCENVTASGAGGNANIYIDYRAIPGYWDGRVICVLEKTSIADTDGKIGIGTATPDYELDVKGTIRADSLRIGNAPVFRLLALRTGWGVADNLTPKWYRDGLGVVHLTGHCFYRLPAGLAEKKAWFNQGQTALDLPPECTPILRTQLRFPNGVRAPVAGSSPVPELWQLLYVESRVIWIGMPGLPDNLLTAMYEVHVFLDGVTYLAAS
jgi:hypothetical protein